MIAVWVGVACSALACLVVLPAAALAARNAARHERNTTRTANRKDHHR